MKHTVDYGLTIDSFSEKYRNSRLIAVGAGKRLKKLVFDYKMNFIFAIDNNTARQGTGFYDSNINIYDWQFLKSNIKPNDVVVITPIDDKELLLKCLEDENIKNNEIITYNELVRNQYDVNRDLIEEKPIRFLQQKLRLIPKIIHFFWFSDDPFPQIVQKCIDSWKRFCPDYEIIKWDLNNWDYTKNRFSREAIEKRQWAFASDFGRADVIYQYGGVYMDSDVELLKSIDDLLYHNAFIGFESSVVVDPGSMFGAEKENSIVKKFCDIYDDKHFVMEDGSYNKIACPGYYTDVLASKGLVLDGSYQLVEGMAVYPYYYFDPHSYVTGKIYKREETYSIHHHAGSWVD